MQSHINVGFGSDVTIAELATAVGQAVGYEGAISFDITRPDGALRKWMDSSKLNKLGWRPQVALEVGLERTYKELVEKNLGF
jgi:GDP-L-fucose synthase